MNLQLRSLTMIRLEGIRTCSPVYPKVVFGCNWWSERNINMDAVLPLCDFLKYYRLRVLMHLSVK